MKSRFGLIGGGSMFGSAGGGPLPIYASLEYARRSGPKKRKRGQGYFPTEDKLEARRQRKKARRS